MTNYDYPSIAYSLSYSITPFDAFQGAWDRFDNEYNMGSAFTVAGDYGGVALLGNTRVGYFTDSSYMEQQFGKHLLENSCIGIAELYSKTSISNQNSINVKRIKFRHNIIGEPEFNIWTAKPMSFNGTSAISDKMFRLSGSCITKGFYGIASKSTVSQTEYNVSNHSLSISLSNALTNSQIATVYVWQNNYLPLTQIVTTGKEIVNENRKIFLTKAIFSADVISGKSYSMGEHPTYLNVGKNSNISINALDNISSDGGIDIQNQGSLSLDTKKINLKNDKVEAGGSLNVKAHSITLEAGMSVEAGATAYFSPY